MNYEGYTLEQYNEVEFDGDNRLRSRKVGILRTGGDMIYVHEGLREGELVSLTGLDNSFRGAEVEIQSRTPSNLLHQSGLPGKATPAVEDPDAQSRP